MSNNMDRFNELTGAVLQELYISFPVPLTIETHDILKRLWGQGALTEDNNEIAIGTLSFLLDEGFITGGSMVESIHFACIPEARLTTKGLAILRSIPRSITGEGDYGEQIGDAIKNGSRSVLRNLINEVITASVMGMMRSSI